MLITTACGDRRARPGRPRISARLTTRRSRRGDGAPRCPCSRPRRPGCRRGSGSGVGAVPDCPDRPPSPAQYAGSGGRHAVRLACTTSAASASPSASLTTAMVSRGAAISVSDIRRRSAGRAPASRSSANGRRRSTRPPAVATASPQPAISRVSSRATVARCSRAINRWLSSALASAVVSAHASRPPAADRMAVRTCSWVAVLPSVVTMSAAGGAPPAGRRGRRARPWRTSPDHAQPGCRQPAGRVAWRAYLADLNLSYACWLSWR